VIQYQLTKKALAMSIACTLVLGLTPSFDGVVYAADADSTQQTNDTNNDQSQKTNEQQKKTAETLKNAQSATPQSAASAEQNENYQFPAMTVEAPRPEWEDKLSPGTVSIVYPDQFKGEQKSLPDLLERVPGVHIRLINGTGQYTVATVRGSTSAQVGIFVDGVLTKLGGDAATDLSMIPMENVARIEVYRGYIPARFAGTWLGGVINIVTKKPQKTGGSFSQGMSSYGGYQGSLNVNFPLGDGSFLLGVNRDQSQGDFTYDNLIYKDSVAHGLDDSGYPVQRNRQNNAYQNTDVLLKWQDANWQVKYNWKRNFRELPTLLAWSSAVYVDIPSRRQAYGSIQTDQNNLLIGRRQTTGNLDWGWQFNYLDQDKNYWNPTTTSSATFAKWSHYQSKRFGGSLDGSFKAGDNNLLELMANYSREELHIDGSNLSYRTDMKNYYVQTLADLQLQDTITLNQARDFWMTPSVRWNYSDGMGKAPGSSNLYWVKEVEKIGGSKVTWQNALKKQLNAHTTLLGTYGTYYRFPNLYEIVGDGATILPSSKYGPPGAEHGTQWDFGVQWQGKMLDAKSELSLTYFGRHSENMMQLYRQGLTYWSYLNVGAGQVHGVELEDKLHWERWDLDLSATYMKTKYLNATVPAATGFGWATNGELGQPFKDIPEWEGLVRLTYRFPGDRLTAFSELRYVDRTYFENYGTVAKPDREWQSSLTTVGLGFKYKLAKDKKLTVGVNDLFNKSPGMFMYDEKGIDGSVSNLFYPIQGRTYYATVQWDF
jgi:vitamin B12 transporter